MNLSAFQARFVSATSAIPDDVFIHRRQAIAVFAALLAGAVGVALVSPRTYTTLAIVAPQSRNSVQSVAGLVTQQLGIPILSSEAAQSPAFYSDLVATRTLLGGLAQSEVSLGGTAPKERVVNLLGINSADSAAANELAIRKLRRLIVATSIPRTGTVNIQVQVESSPQLALALAQGMLAQLDHFNTSTRQTQATAEHKFSAERLIESQAALDSAEGKMRRFLETNREYRNSPILILEYDKLGREVSLKEAIVLTLAQTVERSRIDEARDTPLLTLVQAPELPAVPDGRGLLRKLSFALMMGVGASLALSLRRTWRAAA